MLFWAERRTTQGQPVYAHLFEHPYPGSDSARFGAFHTAEIPYIFGALNLSGATFAAVDHRISDGMQRRWLAFMKTGNPNPGGELVTWQKTGDGSHYIWRIAPADAGPAIAKDRLTVFRQFAAQGGKLGLF